jgi:hypothetical protein
MGKTMFMQTLEKLAPESATKVMALLYSKTKVRELTQYDLLRVAEVFDC